MRRKRIRSSKVLATNENSQQKTGQTWVTSDFLYKLLPALLNFGAAVLRFFSVVL